MDDLPSRAEAPQPPTSLRPTFVGSRGQPPQNLADVLERVLDKGVVIVGDIQVRLLDIELLTIKLRLMIASVDRAREMGINWWEGDPFVTSLKEDGGPDEEIGAGERADLQRRIEALEQQLQLREGSK